LTIATGKTQGDGMGDRQEYEFYKNPVNQVPAGPGRQRQGRRLSATVPVRFPQDIIDAVKRLADRDGLTVSSWIRQVVTREVQRRQPPVVATGPAVVVAYESSGSSEATPGSAAFEPESFSLCVG
jgi:hypothetical protein